jgi:hypothetical protein
VAAGLYRARDAQGAGAARHLSLFANELWRMRRTLEQKLRRSLHRFGTGLGHPTSPAGRHEVLFPAKLRREIARLNRDDVKNPSIGVVRRAGGPADGLRGERLNVPQEMPGMSWMQSLTTSESRLR